MVIRAFSFSFLPVSFLSALPLEKGGEQKEEEEEEEEEAILFAPTLVPLPLFSRVPNAALTPLATINITPPSRPNRL